MSTNGGIVSPRGIGTVIAELAIVVIAPLPRRRQSRASAGLTSVTLRPGHIAALLGERDGQKVKSTATHRPPRQP